MLAFHRSAAGVVKLRDLSLQMSGNDYNVMYQATLMLARMAYGAGYLRPEAALRSSTASDSGLNPAIVGKMGGRDVPLFLWLFLSMAWRSKAHAVSGLQIKPLIRSISSRMSRSMTT